MKKRVAQAICGLLLVFGGVSLTPSVAWADAPRSHTTTFTCVAGLETQDIAIKYSVSGTTQLSVDEVAYILTEYNGNPISIIAASGKVTYNNGAAWYRQWQWSGNATVKYFDFSQMYKPATRSNPQVATVTWRSLTTGTHTCTARLWA